MPVPIKPVPTKPATTMPVIIRSVTKGDLLAVRAQLIETWHATYDPIYGPEKVREITMRWHSLVALAGQIDQPRTAFLLAEQDQAVLGSSYAELQGDTVKLYRLYVHPSAQHQWLGRRLMAETFAHFPAATRHMLEVGPENARARAFYEREGFQRVGDIPQSADPTSVAALIYVRHNQLQNMKKAPAGASHTFE